MTIIEADGACETCMQVESPIYNRESYEYHKAHKIIWFFGHPPKYTE